MEHHGCELDIPLPEIRVEKANPTYAQILLNDYAGKNGELSAITQYFYQYFITKYQYEDFAKDLECISISEMKHMEQLGQLIVLLGGNPLLRTINCGRNTFWCGNNISSTQNIRKFLYENIKAEKIAIQNYRLHISQIQDCYVRAVLERIIKDEEHHISIFNNYLNYFNGH